MILAEIPGLQPDLISAANTAVQLLTQEELKHAASNRTTNSSETPTNHHSD